MLKKTLYLVALGLVFYAKDGHCDPVSASVAIGAAFSTIGAAAAGAGATLGPAGLLAAGSIGTSIFSMLNQPNGPNAPAKADLPDPNAAAATADAEQTKSRRAMLLSGGETTLTGVGGAPLLGSNLATKSLLGG